MNLRSFCALTLLMMIYAGMGLGQTALGTITGIVSDPAGAVVANATVEVKNLNSAQVYRALTTETGNYTVSQVPVGPYELTVTVQ